MIGYQSGPLWARLISLNRDEVLVLADRVHNDDHGTEDQCVIAYCLLLKLGSAYLEVTTPSWVPPNREVPLAVTEAEAWLLRSKVSSFDKLAADSLFGVNLLRKIYQVLTDFNVSLDLPAVAVEGEQMTEERRRALKRRLEGA